MEVTAEGHGNSVRSFYGRGGASCGKQERHPVGRAESLNCFYHLTAAHPKRTTRVICNQAFKAMFLHASFANARLRTRTHLECRTGIFKSLETQNDRKHVVDTHKFVGHTERVSWDTARHLVAPAADANLKLLTCSGVYRDA